jgi:hypothetical protein
MPLEQFHNKDLGNHSFINGIFKTFNVFCKDEVRNYTWGKRTTCLYFPINFVLKMKRNIHYTDFGNNL